NRPIPIFSQLHRPPLQCGTLVSRLSDGRAQVLDRHYPSFSLWEKVALLCEEANLEFGHFFVTSVSSPEGRIPLLGKEGWLRPLRKCREASLAGADGVVGSSHRLSDVERTTPAAPQRNGTI